MIDFNDLHTLDLKRGEEMGYVYFLFHGPKLVYIGQTVTLLGRIAQHRSTKYFTEVKYEMCPVSNLCKREAELIRYFNPILNGLKTRATKEIFSVFGNYIHISGKGSFYVSGENVIDRTNRRWAKFFMGEFGRIVYREIGNTSSYLSYEIYFLDTGEYKIIKSIKENGFNYMLNLNTLSIDKGSKRKLNKQEIKDYRFPNGKYRGRLMRAVERENPQYVRWYKETVLIK